MCDSSLILKELVSYKIALPPLETGTSLGVFGIALRKGLTVIIFLF